MTKPLAGRRPRALLALVFLIPMLSANAVLCALCPHMRLHHHAPAAMMMDMEHNSEHQGCGPELSDGTCAGPQVLVLAAAPVPLPEIPLTNAWTPWVADCLGKALQSISLPRETPPPRA